MTQTIEAQSQAADTLTGTPYANRLLDMPPSLVEIMHRPGGLAPVVSILMNQQRASWPLLDENFLHLDDMAAHRSKVPLDSTKVVIQLNEKRGDRVKSFCFLDAECLPPEQRGFGFGQLFVALNPYPILNDHLTGIYPEHRDQSIDLLLSPALKLARALGREFAVFYNGPLSGASAPKHAHIQAVRYDALPVRRSIARIDRSAFQRKEGKSLLYMPADLGRTILAIDSPDITAAERGSRAVIERLPREPGDPYDEPRLNLLIRSLGADGMRVLISPRTSREVTLDNKSVLLPATLEAIGGFVIVTEKKDFTHLKGNQDEVQHIFDKTTRSHEETRDVLRDLDIAA